MANTKKPAEPVCVWTNEDEYYRTACDHLFQFTDGGPVENEQRYCGYCGRTLKVKAERRRDGEPR